ncbi:hypothetical protein CDLVIII_0540 [Clostridium sp. DL-VIII]|uniref:TniQ family protein n=1 Tax=Clostridium sp. DL-VIII TaxID=641107 RepID=UPI00023AF4E7|nr:TniQ family protein [Clostridium sp. DL-VIII]EHI97275.1 hypothetical protein CDLVIII_0540 [Clostridium sp. DL-VIII]
MDIRLPIRLSIVEGESFSGYIIRSARAMGVDCKEFFKYIIYNCNIHYKFKDNIINVAYSQIAKGIDVFPFEILKENNICSIFNKSKEEIENATFKNVFDVLNVKLALGKEHIGKELVKDVRRFCPLCLKENGIYKLMWQIKDIKICDIHNIKLVSYCGVCNSKQRYFSSYLGNYICSNCHSLLWEKVNRDDLNINKLNEQILAYNNWKFLLKYKNKLVKIIPHYNFNQSLAITMLYIAQNQENTFQIENIKQFHEKTICNIVKFINNNEIGEKVTLNGVKRIANDKNILLKSLPNIEVPISYIQSLVEQRKKAMELMCLSPWCDFFGKNDKIEILGKCNSKSNEFVKKFVCTECNMRFGYNFRKNMCEPFNKTFFNNIPKIKEMILKGKIQGEIVDTLGISAYLYTKILAYLLLNNLVNSNVETNSYMIIPIDIKDRFNVLFDKKCLTDKKAKKIFGWSYFQFHYYYWLPEIQNFLINKEKYEGLRRSQFRPQKRNWKKVLLIAIYYFLKRDIDICYKNTNKYFQISREMLLRHKLGDIFETSMRFQANKKRIEYNLYIIKKVANYLDKFKFENVLLKDLFAKTKINRYQLTTNYPDLEKYVVRKVKIHNLKVREQEIERYKVEIEKIYLKSIENGELETIRSISLKLGKEYKFISRCPELNTFTKELLKRNINTKSDN